MTTETLTLPDFLLARIAEDEAVARSAIDDDGGQTGGMEDSFDLLTGRKQWFGANVLPRYGEPVAALIVHTAVPARVLAECKAKRAIVGLAVPFGWDDDGTPVGSSYVEAWWDALGALASVYADHPDYCAEWSA